MLRLRTIQTIAFRCLIELLKDILVDVNFIFDEHGVSLVTMDNRHTALVQVVLNAEHFEEYETRCRKQGLEKSYSLLISYITIHCQQSSRGEYRHTKIRTEKLFQ